MATFYTGLRTVLRGRDLDTMVHAYTGEKGVYSYYGNYSSTGTVLTGAPNNQYVIGTKNDIRLLEYIYAGRPHVAPLKDPGAGARLSYHRLNPYENKATDGAKVFLSGYGHVERDGFYGNYNNWIFDGVVSSQPMASTFGHPKRTAQTYGGAFDPYVNAGVGERAGMANVGQADSIAYDSSQYGRNKVNIWRGTPSSRAL